MFTQVDVGVVVATVYISEVGVPVALPSGHKTVARILVASVGLVVQGRGSVRPCVSITVSEIVGRLRAYLSGF